jgi:hypothetical protein
VKSFADIFFVDASYCHPQNPTSVQSLNLSCFIFFQIVWLFENSTESPASILRVANHMVQSDLTHNIIFEDKFLEGQQQVLESNLSITSVSLGNAGQYSCIIPSHDENGGPLQKASFKLTILPSEEKHLGLDQSM